MKAQGSGCLDSTRAKSSNQANTRQQGYQDQTNTSWYTSQVKQVADNIDDEDGAQFPSTQALAAVAFKETGADTDDLAVNQPRQSIDSATSEENLCDRGGS